MNLMPLEKLGPIELPGNRVHFGLYLPWVSARDGNRLWVKVIHEHDQFLQHVQPKHFELAHAPDPVYSDYWSGEILIDPSDRSHPSSAWGQPGRYVYRFMLRNPSVSHEIDWIVDPFAREFGVGKLSAFTLGYTESHSYTWSEEEANWKTPKLSDLVIYEMMISEFGGSIEGAIEKLGYLADLGINCLEVMPVSNVANTIDWGFLPIGYFGVDERFGKRCNMQRFVDEAHKRGIAVIFDAVYGHTDWSFPYSYLYRELKYNENPFVGGFAKDYFGESVDYRRQIVRDFFFTVNLHWLDCYHADGFRYDCVPNYYDGSVGAGYSNLVYNTYQAVKDKVRQNKDYWQRFSNGQDITLIQCAEQLEEPVEIVSATYSNCTWQNETLGAAKGVAHGSKDAITNLGFCLGLSGYPEQEQHNADVLPKTALQYIENHDHSRFICNFIHIDQSDLLRQGDRSLWYRLQPYIIGLLTAKGIPMLWQGQEFGENYFVPNEGWGRVMLMRPVRWDYFYDSIGKAVIALFRKMLALRKSCVEFREGGHYFCNHYDNYQSKGVLLFHRKLGSAFSLVALNFSDQEQWVPYAFPQSGNYQEMLHGADVPALNLGHVTAGATRWLQVPGNYGRVWRTE